MFFAFECVLLLTVLAVAFTRAEPVVSTIDRITARCRFLWCSPARAILATIVAAVVLRGILLPVLGPSIPRVHDEHSMMLQARTMLGGEFAVPAHAMWRSFESFHVNALPTYSSIYFFGRSIPLLIGLWVADEPWFGVWLTMIALSGAVTWMLAGYVRSSLAFLGGMTVVLRFGVVSYWINSLWGGAFTALGATLVLGAMVRLTRRFRLAPACALAIGLVMLMTSRPFEGLVFCIPIALFLAWHAWVHLRHGRYLAVAKVVLPVLASVLLGGAAMLAANQATTGNMLVTGYEINRSTYALAPAMLFSPLTPPRSVPTVRFASFYQWEATAHRGDGSVRSLVKLVAGKLAALWRFYVGPLLTLPLIAGLLPAVRRHPVAIAAAAMVGAAFLVETWTLAHYVAPVLPAVILVAVAGLDRIAGWSWRRRPVGGALARLLPACFVLLLLLPVAHLVSGRPKGLKDDRWNSPCCAFGRETQRSRILSALERRQGRHLVLVRYRRNAAIHTEWVYNEPDIDAAKVVFATYLDDAQNARLRAYYSDRSLWIVDGISTLQDGRLRLVSSALPPRER